MEIRRKRTRSKRRRGGYSSGGRGGSSVSEAGKTFLSLLLIGGAVWLVSASAAGTWLAQNVVAPVIAKISAQVEEPNIVGSIPSDDGIVLSSSAREVNMVSEEIRFPSLDCSLLQMGVYSSEDNAMLQSQKLKEQGAGGFVLEENIDGETLFRVFASGYQSDESAKSVKNRLVESGVDCTIYNMATAEATFKVTAASEHIEAISAGFSALHEAELELIDAAVSFDKNKMSIPDGKALVSDILSQLNHKMVPLLEYEKSDAALSALVAAYKDCVIELDALNGGVFENSIGFSSKLKHTQLYMACRYALLANSFVDTLN